MRLHAHKWEKVGELFNAPHPSLRKIDRGTERMFLAALNGFTVVTYKCSRCPAQKYDEVIGRTAGAS